MADYIHFCVNDIRHFHDGADDASTKLSQIDREADARATKALFDADNIIRHVDGVLNTMEEDKRTASAVRDHNKEALSRMENRLYELEREAVRLAQECQEAYRHYLNAQSYEARITTMPYSENASAEEKRARANAVDAAHRATQNAHRHLENIQKQEAAVKRAIEELKKLIATTKKLIEALYKIIKELEDAIRKAAEYRRRLIDDKHKLQWELPKYATVRHDSAMALSHCTACARKATEHGRSLCRYLDPDGNVASDSCYISFSDRKALLDISNTLRVVCGEYEDSEDTVRERSKARNAEMQDNVMRQTAQILANLLSECKPSIRKLRETSRDCKAAHNELNAYYELKHSSY